MEQHRDVRLPVWPKARGAGRQDQEVDFEAHLLKFER